MDSKSITATKGRLDEVMDNAVNKSIKSYGIEQKIKSAVDKASVRTGVVTKVYQYLDKVEVKLDSTGKKVLCKNLHKYSGDMIDLYTPLEESRKFCNKLKEPCIIPRFKLHCAVLSIHDKDSNEHLLLGYYQNEELVGLNPAKPGNIKLTSLTDTNQFWIKFGREGLDLRLPSKTTGKVGGLDENMEDIDYDNKNLYSKAELDKIFEGYEERIKALEETIAGSNNNQQDDGS